MIKGIAATTIIAISRSNGLIGMGGSISDKASYAAD